MLDFFGADVAMVTVSIVAGLEAARSLGLLPAIQQFADILRRAHRALPGRKSSDHWKQRAAKGYSTRLFHASLVVGGSLCVGILPITATLLLITGSLDGALEVGVTPAFVLTVVAVSSLWWFLRSRNDFR